MKHLQDAALLVRLLGVPQNNQLHPTFGSPSPPPRRNVWAAGTCSVPGCARTKHTSCGKWSSSLKSPARLAGLTFRSEPFRSGSRRSWACPPGELPRSPCWLMEWNAWLPDGSFVDPDATTQLHFLLLASMTACQWPQVTGWHFRLLLPFFPGGFPFTYCDPSSLPKLWM